MQSIKEEVIIVVSFSLVVLYALAIHPTVLLLQRGWYQGEVVASSNYTDWEMGEYRTRIYTAVVDGERRYTMGDINVSGKVIHIDTGLLLPDGEVEAEDQYGNRWYVFFPADQANIPTRRFTVSSISAAAYAVTLILLYRFRWRIFSMEEKTKATL